MICYRDMTFCGFKECGDFKGCGRALTEDVQAEALKWAATFHDGDISKAQVEGPGVAQFVDKPECFKGEQI